jgi:cobalt/nickel transport system permease protein
MHIEEGALSLTTENGALVLSPEGIGVLCVGAAVAVAGTAIGLRRLDYERVPQVGMLSAAFFVASLIHVYIGPTSVHLVLNGLVGLILGWAAFPAILIALLLQAVLFGFGGLSSLGINTAAMAAPAIVMYHLFHPLVRSRHEGAALVAGFAAGALAVLLSGLIVAGSFWVVGKPFQSPAIALLVAHLPLAAIEGFVTGSAVAFLRKVRPELLDAPLLPPVIAEAPNA